MSISPARNYLFKVSMRISVAMCTFNGEKHIEEQLESIAGQDRPADELVICDDGSQDGTLALIEQFARRAPLPVCLVRNERNLGYSKNFSKAIGLCSGDVIALADQDDVWYANKLSRLEEGFTADLNAGGIFSDGDLIDDLSRRVEGSLWASFGFLAEHQERLRSGEAVHELVRRNVVTGMAFAFRSSWRQALEKLPASWPHDAWLALMLAKEGRLVACGERLVAYRVHGDQQIGVPIRQEQKRELLGKRGLKRYLEVSKERNLREYNREVSWYEGLLAAYPNTATSSDEKLLFLAREKLAYARMGLHLLSQNRLRRWPGLLSNWKRYKSYSATGLRAWLRDFAL